MLIIGLFWRFLPKEVRITAAVILSIVFTAGWIIIGDHHSTYVEFSATNDPEAYKRNLPAKFLPVQPGSELFGVREEHQKRPFDKGTDTVTGYFTMPYLESTVADYYHIQLKKDGWKISKDQHNDKGTTIEASKDEMNGTVRIDHLDAGSQLELAVAVIAKE